MSNKPLLAIGTMLLGAGIAVGFVVSGRLSPSERTFASPQTPPITSRPSMAMAAGTLPNLSDIAEDAIKAAVNISSTQEIRQRYNDPFRYFFGDQTPRYATSQAQSLGSGVVVSPDGYILTNSHVVLGEGEGTIKEVKVTIPGRDAMTAKIIGVDQLTDLAVLKVDAQGLHTLPWGDSDKVRIAEWVLAIGNPFQFNQTVTLGIVSARGRTQLGTYAQMIQTDAAINPGNSGGLLINARGELIGINSMIYSRGGGSEGLGFAIPANLAQRIMKELIANGVVKWGTIADVQFDDVQVNQRAARQFGITSASVVWVTDLLSSSAASRAGLRREDVVLKVDAQSVADTNELQRLLADKKGTTVELEVLRGNGQHVKIKVPVTSTQDQKR